MVIWIEGINYLSHLWIFHIHIAPQPQTPCSPLTPGPQDPVIPHLNSFIPAYHYALSKVRCNPPVNLSAGVEQQAHEYLIGLCESRPIQRVRLDYDIKLDDREKLFAAPKQRFNWESYIKSYFYSPGPYTMPVEKAKNLVEMFRGVPESSTDPETTDKAEAKQKEVLPDTHGLKRKVAEEAQNMSAKCSRMASPSNGEAEESQGRQNKYAREV